MSEESRRLVAVAEGVLPGEARASAPAVVAGLMRELSIMAAEAARREWPDRRDLWALAAEIDDEYSLLRGDL